VALIRAKIIARLHGSLNCGLAELSWEWIMRADGQVFRRLTVVNGRQERNPWQLITRMPAAKQQAARKNHTHAEVMLVELARQHGHQTGQPPG
jgi:hypothetical protein